MERNHISGNGDPEKVPSPFVAPPVGENPYLQRSTGVEDDAVSQQSNDVDEAGGGECGAPIELEDEDRRARNRRLRRQLIVITIVLFVSVVLVNVLYRQAPTRVDYGTESKGRPPVPASTSTRDSRTEKAIEEAQRLAAGQTANDRKNANTASGNQNTNPNMELPFKYPPGSEAFNTPTPNTNQETNISAPTNVGAGPPSNTQLNSTRPNIESSHSQRNSETSLYMSELSTENRHNTPPRATPTPGVTAPPRDESRNKVLLPEFGTMLPVETIGGLFTLRTGALVRLELTREISGSGWSMKRGTILIGNTKGGDLDRAYVSLMGFIDPESGKLVKLGGEILGGDGAAGLKGKRRQLDGGWRRVLGRLSATSLEVAGALLSGRGRDTVVITDGLRTKTINPVTDELSGVLGNELDRGKQQSFVEVMAGTAGYILVTELPSVVAGEDAKRDLNSEALLSLSDVDATRTATGLSERELADLLANGSPEQIKSALPRMSPEMRRIAEAVLKP